MKFLKKILSPKILAIKVYLKISVISLVLGLYIFEGYLTFKKTEQEKKEILYEKKINKKWDIRTRLQIYEDLKKKNNKIEIAVGGFNYRDKNHSIFPLSGISNSETIHCNENGYYSIYQSDRYGFNNPDTEWDEKKIEYFLVGDSHIQGACVNRQNDISSILRALSNKSVLNLGYSGNGTLIEYATLREYLDKNIKKIIWVYYEGNDLKELIFELENKILNNYLSDLNFTQHLKLRQNNINDLARTLVNDKMALDLLANNAKLQKDKKFKYKILKFIRLNNLKKIIPKIDLNKEENKSKDISITRFKQILKLAKDLVIKNNSKLYFVYLPEYSRFKIDYNNTNYNLIKKIVSELNIPFIDISKEVFEKEQNPLKLFLFELHGHYSIEGYRKVAETIYKFTKD